jgi:hypothetical protein
MAATKDAPKTLEDLKGLLAFDIKIKVAGECSNHPKEVFLSDSGCSEASTVGFHDTGQPLG